MMKKIILSTLLMICGAQLIAQNLPENPEPGKCYVRCKTPEVWKNEDVKIEIYPEYNKIITHPATYKTVTERVMIKEEGKRLEIVPAVWETKEVSYVAKEDANALKVIKASFGNDSKVIETKPSSAIWEMSEKAPDCESPNPDDCRYWCYKPIPAEYETVPLTTLVSDASTEKSPVSGFNKTFKKRVMVTPPTTREVVIPAEYATIEKTKLVKDAWQEKVTVPAKYKTVVKQILVDKGGLTSWKEVDCKLISYNPLPINWRLGSATLTKDAKYLIDSRLLPILKDGVAVEIASHTDSRSSKSFNQDLSDRRAKAVADYLISKGINPTQLVAKGYGETRLKNRCSDGVSCSETEHLANRRTEFRIINQK
jgi:outer membrane protein OmpA-like peptidoglycan-associated protein